MPNYNSSIFFRKMVTATWQIKQHAAQHDKMKEIIQHNVGDYVAYSTKIPVPR
jgi:hypothetical protein